MSWKKCLIWIDNIYKVNICWMYVYVGLGNENDEKKYLWLDESD